MATAWNFDAAIVRELDDLVARGRFPSPEAAVREGLRLIREQDDADEPLSAEHLALLERRIAEADADPDGNIPAEEVFAELRQRYQSWK